MAWKGAITNSGSELLAQWTAGKTLTITRAAAGTGRVSEAAMLAQTALVSEKQTASILSNKTTAQGQKLQLQVTPLATGYPLNQLGIWAKLDSGAARLIALFQTDTDAGVEIPSKTDVPDYVYTFYGLLEFTGSSGTLQVTIDPSALATTQVVAETVAAAIRAHDESETAHSTALEKKQEKITVSGLLKSDGKGGISAQQFDTKPTKDSGNLLTSGAVAAAMDAAAALTSAAEYSAAMPYAVGAYCTKDGKLYRCTVAIPQAEAWNAAHWTATTMGAELVAIYTTLANNDPRQWGLGTTNIGGESYDANNCAKNGWYICNVNTPNGAWWYVFTAANYSNAVIVQKAWYYNSGKVIECMRMGWLDVSVDRGGGWQPWEYVNPPMLIDVEYRTTERYLDKPVYTMAVDCGAITSGMQKDVSKSLPVLDVLSCNGVIHENSNGHNQATPFDYSTTNGTKYSVTVSAEAHKQVERDLLIIYITSDWNVTGRVCAIVRYTKETD